MKKVKYTSPKEILEQDKEFMLALGKKLYDLRKKNKLTLNELSDQVKISRKTLGLYEDGSIYFNFGILLKLIRYFDESPFEFFINIVDRSDNVTN